MFNTYETLIQGLLDKGFESVDNWLTAEQLNGLRKSLLTRYQNDNFRVAGIGNKDNLQTAKRVRNDQIHWLETSKADDNEKTFLNQINHFVQYLNETCMAGLKSFEFHHAVYEQGSFYKKHVDQFVNDDSRQFSVVLYLTEAWSEGDGGELLLYTNNNTVNKVQPLPGRLVFFKSTIPHEVLTSNITRLSVTGWLKNRA